MNETLKDILGAILVAAITITSLFLAELARADVTLPSGGKMTIHCSQAPTPGPTPPPDPGPTPPPSAGKCAKPVGYSRKLQVGQEPKQVGQQPGVQLGHAPANRHFCSSNYPKGTYLSWGPLGAAAFNALTVIVSETPNNTNVRSVPRGCYKAGSVDRMQVLPRGDNKSSCRIKPNTLYYVSMVPKNPITGRYHCTGSCQAVLYNSPHK